MSEIINSEKPALYFWHGASRWEGLKESKSTKGAQSKHGPGLYLTTALDTASKYAKGGGKMVLLKLDSDINILEGTRLSLEELLEGLASIPRVKKRKEIIEGLNQAFIRHPDNRMPAEYLVNWLVNNESVGGESGVALSNWLCSKGIDASLCNAKYNEDWLLVFNTKKIQTANVYKSSQAYEIGDFPRYEEQLSELPASQLSVKNQQFLENKQKYKIKP